MHHVFLFKEFVGKNIPYEETAIWGPDICGILAETLRSWKLVSAGMEECGAGLPARNGLAQPLVKAGVLLICHGFSRSQKMHKSVYNATVRVARLLHRPSYKFITRNTTVWKKSVSEHPLSPASPRKADVPAPAPLREGSQPQPLFPIHPGAAALKPRSTWTCCPGYSLASKGAWSYKSHFSSSLCATSLLVIPDFYTLRQGAAAFAAIPREARHTRDRNRCCCRAARDKVAQWLAQISKPAQGQLWQSPRATTASTATDFAAKKTHREGKGMELQVQPDKRLQMYSELHTGKGGLCLFTAAIQCHPLNTQVCCQSALWLTVPALEHYRQTKHLQFSLLCQISTIYATCDHVICW